ncbi:energy transducer TonB [Vibrio spartinae]|uniref:Protein TonB n=1 Tax=Vibrio spartinae TaxID=1918945 RepID=A0A1N6M3C6_9VIBR|nr:energy transducer TonB [Vibrio spartinae]QMV14465.1 transport protein TonB [Vibrio spartinae]SIO93943.1 transport protein TonB [Vibrio spartinae]
MMRWLCALPVAIVFSVALFSFMAWMVDNGSHQKPEEHRALQFNMVMTEPDDAVQRRQRTVPEKPKPPEAPQMTSAAQQQSAVDHVPMMASVPDLGLSVGLEGVAIQAPAFDISALGGSRQAIPLYQIKPDYPPRAKRREIEGSVTLQFDIDESGRAVNVQVIDSQPKRIFDRSARRAIRQWKFQPRIVNGKAEKQVGMTQIIKFEMDK